MGEDSRCFSMLGSRWWGVFYISVLHDEWAVEALLRENALKGILSLILTGIYCRKNEDKPIGSLLAAGI